VQRAEKYRAAPAAVRLRQQHALPHVLDDAVHTRLIPLVEHPETPSAPALKDCGDFVQTWAGRPLTPLLGRKVLRTGAWSTRARVRTTREAGSEHTTWSWKPSNSALSE
jgi:hypothetical protein